MPHAHTQEEFRKAVSQYGLTNDQLGLPSIIDSSRALLIGFFATAFIYERVSLLAPDSHLIYLTVIVLAVTAPLLFCVSTALQSRWAFGAWRNNEAWCQLLLRCGNALRTSCFFVCTHFVYGVGLRAFRRSRCSLLECLALIPLLVVLLNLLVQVFRPSVPHSQ